MYANSGTTSDGWVLSMLSVCWLLWGHSSTLTRTPTLTLTRTPTPTLTPAPTPTPTLHMLRCRGAPLLPFRSPVHPSVALSRAPPNIHPVSAALSPRLVGGVDINLAGELARAQHAKLFGAMEAAKKRTGAGAVAVTTPLPAAKRPNVVVVVLESTTGTLATASNSHGVSPWLKELSGR